MCSWDTSSSAQGAKPAQISSAGAAVAVALVSNYTNADFVTPEDMLDTDALGYVYGDRGILEETKMNANNRRFAGLLIVVALMNGCSVVDYKNPVETLNTAIADSAETIIALDDKLTQLQNERWSEQIQMGELSLEPVDMTCALGTERCSLNVRFKDGSTKPFPATSLIPKARLALNGLKTYAERLKAITDADTASKVATSANEALGSIQNLATTISNETGSKTSSDTIAAFQEPAVGVIEWSVTRYVEYVKFKALAQSTKRAHPVIVTLSTWYAITARGVALTELTNVNSRFITAQMNYDNMSEKNKLTGAKIETYVQAATNYDAALKAVAAQPLEKFTIAHKKLMQELNGENGVSLAEATAAIERLSNEAKAFKKIIKRFENAIDAKGGN